MYSVKLRCLNQDEVNKIAENKITRYELLGKKSDWASIEKCSRGIDRKTIKTFVAEAENAGLTLREYLEKRAFPAWFEIMERLYDAKQVSDFVKALKLCSKEMTAAKNRKIIAIIVVAVFVFYGCITPVIFKEHELILICIEFFYVAVTLLVYFAAEHRAFKKFLKRMETDGITANMLGRSNRMCEKMYWEYPCRITLRYIKKYNPQAAQKILASLKKK